MQRVPAIAKATVAFNRAVFAPVSATRHGVDDDKMAAIYEYSTSDLFNEAERAALDYALAAGSVPNGVTDEIYANLKPAPSPSPNHCLVTRAGRSANTNKPPTQIRAAARERYRGGCRRR